MSAVLSRPADTSPWRQALAAVAACAALVLLLYRDSFVAMVGIWNRSDTFAHCFLVLPLSLWLIWRRRQALARMPPKPQPWVLLPMLLVAGAWLLGDMAGANALTQLCATALLVLVVPAVLGLAIARELLFPLGFLFFMVPLGEFLLPTLMAWTADFTVAAIALSGIPVYREGLNFIIPSGSWSVVEACSGVRYLIASFMVGSLFAYLNYRSTKRRLIFCAVAILVPVIANWLRAYMIVMLGHLSGNQLAVGVDHLVYGWVFFGIVILIMFMIGARWSEPDPEPASAAAQPAAVAAAALPSHQASPWLAAAAAAAVLLLPHVGLWKMAHSEAAPAAAWVWPELPGWAMAPEQQPLFEPVFAGASTSASRTFGNGAAEVTVHLAYYRQQGYGRKLVSSSNTLVRSDDRAWTRSSERRQALTVGGRELRWRVVELAPIGSSDHARARVEARQIYWVDGQYTDSDAWATLWGVRGRLAGRGDDGAMLTLFSAGTAEQTGPRLDAFIRTQLPLLQAQLASMQARR